MKVINRCSGCRKRVGFTGFRCRCEEFVIEEYVMILLFDFSFVDV
ncbi:putative AN1-like Zinc finger [Helianthus anomalus]